MKLFSIAKNTKWVLVRYIKDRYGVCGKMPYLYF